MDATFKPKPRIKVGPADKYADATETIVEFNSGEPNGPGGLMSLRRMPDGTLTVSLYRLDTGVAVSVSDIRDGQ